MTTAADDIQQRTADDLDNAVRVLLGTDHDYTGHQLLAFVCFKQTECYCPLTVLATQVLIIHIHRQKLTQDKPVM